MCVVPWVQMRNSSQNLLLMMSQEAVCIPDSAVECNTFTPPWMFPSVVSISASINLIKQDRVEHDF